MLHFCLFDLPLCPLQQYHCSSISKFTSLSFRKDHSSFVFESASLSLIPGRYFFCLWLCFSMCNIRIASLFKYGLCLLYFSFSLYSMCLHYSQICMQFLPFLELHFLFRSAGLSSFVGYSDLLNMLQANVTLIYCNMKLVGMQLIGRLSQTGATI